MKNLRWGYILGIGLIIKFLFHLALNSQWSFHRDELLYLALGRHLDWGYASVPPGIGFWAWVSGVLLGGSVTVVRLTATLFGTMTILFTGLIAKEISTHTGPSHVSTYAMILIGITGLTAGAFLRPAMLFMPVVFDIFYWTLLCWLLIKYINSDDSSWLLWMGLATGVGLLNKYTVLIFLFALLPGILFSRHRKIFKQKKLYFAVGIVVLMVSPNLYWQYMHQWPVIRHMSELAATQFVHVSLSGFFTDQLLFFLPALPIWLIGFYYLLVNRAATSWRIFAWMYLMVLLVLMAFSAKSYYSIGAYPILIAAGAVYIDQKTQYSYRWIRYALPAFMLLIGLINLPASIPLLPPQQEVNFVQQLNHIPGFEGILRWEDGQLHSLPQDFADMLGWEELAQKTGEIWHHIENKTTAAIYAENYGQAGAIEHFGKKYMVPNVLCFSDNYRYWLPDSLPSGFQTLIYVNDELGDDMPGFFEKIDKIFELDMPLSRQHGDQIYLCQYPTPAFFDRINTAIHHARHDEVIED